VGGVTSLTVLDPDERADLGAFVARVVRLDAAAMVRLRGTAAGGACGAGGVGEISAGEGSADASLASSLRVTAWASTPFDVLATRTVHGELVPDDVTVSAQALLTALTVERAATVDPGVGGLWQGELPPSVGWSAVDEVPAAELERLSERGLAVARENAGPLGPPASLLDQTVLTVTAASGPVVKVPLRCLFALSGMGFLGETGLDVSRDVVRVSATSAWLRLDARYGAVVRRRITALPLLVS
jgi:hypothetical protein